MSTIKKTETELQQTELPSDFVKEVIDEGVKLYRKHLRQLHQDLEEFAQRRKEANARIKQGARRTNGRIV